MPNTVVIPGHSQAVKYSMDKRPRRFYKTPNHCLHCGSPFFPPYGRREQKYCSHSCSYAHRVGSNHEHHGRRSKDYSITCVPILCGGCGKEFTPRHSKMKCCSYKCAMDMVRSRRIEIECENCGEKKIVPPNFSLRFCSHDCFMSWNVGDNHPNSVPIGHRRKVDKRGSDHTPYAIWVVKTETGWRPEHQVVLERKLGRPIRDGYDVHHTNEDSLDNDPGNLEELTKRDHQLRHWEIRRARARGVECQI